MNGKKELCAVALKYPPNTEAPLIVAKSKGHLAQVILNVAKENDIPIVKNDIAESLVTIGEIGECIPEQVYGVVAQIFAMIGNLEGAGKK